MVLCLLPAPRNQKWFSAYQIPLCLFYFLVNFLILFSSCIFFLCVSFSSLVRLSAFRGLLNFRVIKRVYFCSRSNFLQGPKQIKKIMLLHEQCLCYVRAPLRSCSSVFVSVSVCVCVLTRKTRHFFFVYIYASASHRRRCRRRHRRCNVLLRDVRDCVDFLLLSQWHRPALSVITIFHLI